MRRNYPTTRCPRCGIRKALCFCDWIPAIALETRVVVLMHVLERVETTNTAKLATKVLTNSQIQVHGLEHERLSASSLNEPGRNVFLLYPSSHAPELTPEFAATLARPITLIVPDADWRTTKKFVRREPALIGIPHLRLPIGPASEFRLRAQPHPNGVCTLEAIARAIGILESPQAQQALEKLLRVMVERTLWSRGMLSAEQCVAGGIPPEAFRNDPRHDERTSSALPTR